MTRAILEIVEIGMGVSFQDAGRRGWKRFGVPPGGALDDHACRWANRLVGNTEHLPVLEILLMGARFRALETVEIAITGAAASGDGQRWQTRRLESQELFTFPPPAHGVWSYLACAGGWEAPRWFGSVSCFPRGGLGRALTRGDVLHAAEWRAAVSASAIGTRWLQPSEQRDYRDPGMLRVWKAPQWDGFEASTRSDFFSSSWHISAQSDRTGYRLIGPTLNPPPTGIASEPVLPGSIQVPPNGQPIITMRDGPTVGGYAKLGLLDPENLSRLAQCRPGQTVRFQPAD
jgi:biotin-dependent carboxylase-like uncharacterized protein